jgi:NAD(P)-dependent dehydrogenase (short-subunit alcohol dehydrogenase family)
VSDDRPLGTVLITGGASGLGAATAQRVREQGGTPVVLDRAAPADGIEHERVDLADGRATEAAVRAIVDRHDDLSGVLCAGGTDVCGALAEVDADRWEQVVAVNLLGTAAVARASLPALERSGGTLVTVASTLGFRALPDATAYCASKFGVVGMTRALAAETQGRVRVTLLVPGGMQTAFFDGRPEQYRPAPDQVLNDPGHVADAVLFAIRQPGTCELRELVVTTSVEGSWPP